MDGRTCAQDLGIFKEHNALVLSASKSNPGMHPTQHGVDVYTVPDGPQRSNYEDLEKVIV